MSQGSLSHQKTVNKARHWHWHGKHRPILGWLVAERREREGVPPPMKEPMFGTVAEAFRYWRRRWRS